ncbi:MAG: hypothetical protein ABEH65_11905 [Halobacteriales archaeon]
MRQTADSDRHRGHIQHDHRLSNRPEPHVFVVLTDAHDDSRVHRNNRPRPQRRAMIVAIPGGETEAINQGSEPRSFVDYTPTV